ILERQSDTTKARYAGIVAQKETWRNNQYDAHLTPRQREIRKQIQSIMADLSLSQNEADLKIYRLEQSMMRGDDSNSRSASGSSEEEIYYKRRRRDFPVKYSMPNS
ncbi:hypothetical protein PFISCL1PPCAC_25010, partial [Pristionchus fissidentatus]